LRISFDADLQFMLGKLEQLKIRDGWGFDKDKNNYYLHVAEAI